MAKPTYDDARLVAEFARLAAESKFSEAMDWIWSDQFIPDYDKFVKKYPLGSKEHAKVSEVCGFFETVGALWKNGVFSEDLLFDWLWINGPWDRLKGFALARRKAANNNAIYELFEAMAEAQKQLFAKFSVGSTTR